MDARFRIIFLFSVVFCSKAEKLDNLKLCVVKNPELKLTPEIKYCELLKNSKHDPISCIYAPDRLECLKTVSEGKADFSMLEMEDLYFSTLWNESSVLVVSEIKSALKKQFRNEMVLLVRKDRNITNISELRGKKLCHPGYKDNPTWNALFAQYFEERVAPATCDENLSLLEDRIKTTSNYFESACKAGPWSSNNEEDTMLKEKYWNLCSLCDGGECKIFDKYHGTGGSITCFRDGVGDILWTAYDESLFQYLSLSVSSDNYYYLCENGTLLPFKRNESCVWLAEPWQVLVANRKSASKVQKKIEMISDWKYNDWKYDLLHIFEPFTENVQNLLVSKTPEDYLRSFPGFLSANALYEGNCKPKRSVKLCVASPIENEKCEWMSKAASAIGIQPSLECVQKPNVTACLISVGREDTDVVSVTADFFYDAAVKHNLKPFLLETGNQFKNNYLASVVVRERSEIKNISGLKGKKICLTRKNGVGWWTLSSVLYEKSLINSPCEDLRRFFNGVCALNSEEKDGVEKCCPEDSFGNEERDLLRCLRKSGCDAAILDSNTILETQDNENTKWNKSTDSDIRFLCESDERNDCYWMWSNNNYLMSSHSEPRSRKSIELFNFFSQLGKYFGKRKRPMLQIFRPFRDVQNVLFRDTSTNFVAVDNRNQTNSYLDKLERLKLCSDATQNRAFLLLTLFSTVVYNFL